MTEEQNGKPEERLETEVVAKPKRRQHTAEYKLRILRELDGCTRKGEVGAILRREGLYSSLISKWREQREQGSLSGLGGQRRGPKVDPNAAELARLQGENQRLKEELERMYQRYAQARKPAKGRRFDVAYRLRNLVLDRWNLWPRLTFYRTWKDDLGHPKLDGTNNDCERCIGWWIKERYRTMRGYKREQSALNLSRLIAHAGNHLSHGLDLATLMP